MDRATMHGFRQDRTDGGYGMSEWIQTWIRPTSRDLEQPNGKNLSIMLLFHERTTSAQSNVLWRFARGASVA